MESKAKLLGHPAHPMFVVFPLGLLISAVVFDGLFAWTARPEFATVAFWNLAGGVLTGLIAAAIGLIDFLAVPSGTRAKRIGWFHGLGNVLVVGLFTLSWWMRLGTAGHVPDFWAQTLAILGLLLGAVTGWLGGELVDRLGVGIDEGANLNAPSSLQGASAEREGESKRRYA